MAHDHVPAAIQGSRTVKDSRLEYSPFLRRQWPLLVGSWRISRPTGLAKDGAVARHDDVSHRGDPYGEVAAALGRSTVRSGDERRDRVRRVHRGPSAVEAHDEERDDFSAAQGAVVPGERCCGCAEV